MAVHSILHLPFHRHSFPIPLPADDPSPLRASPLLLPHASPRTSPLCHAQKKKKKFLDFFDWGEDPKMEYGDLYSDGGLQEPEQPRFPIGEDGFMEFPAQHNAELASLPLLIRGDVRRCCCFVAGGVYENLLFFPVIQLLTERYPGVRIDVVSTPRGKQTYELNKYIKRAWAYELDAHFVVPADYTEFYGKIKNEYYDMIVSTRLGGLGHSITMFITDARERIGYVYPNVNAAGSGLFLTEALKAPRLNLAEGGYHMYSEIIEVFTRPKKNVPLMTVRPLEIAIARKLKDYVQKKYMQEGVSKGEFLVFHGIESISKASMKSNGDPDSLLPLTIWSELAHAASSKVVFVIPYEPDRGRVREAVGEANIVFITTPGQLAAIINDSLGVVTTNTAAVQLACALKIPSVALFSSAEKASLFVPDAREKRCATISSDTGRLVDIDVNAAISAMKALEAKMLVTA